MSDTAFTTYWGNALLGMYVTWNHDAGGATTPSATAELKATFDINLYAAGVVSQAGSGAYFQSNDAVTFYLNILNPIDKFDKDASTSIVDNELVGFDGLFMTLFATVAGDGTTSGTPWSLEIRAASDTATNVMVDIFCDSTLTEGQYDSSKCKDDREDFGDKVGLNGLNDWTNDSADGTDYCKEKWTIATKTDASTTTFYQRCVKMQIIGKRLFLTTDNTDPADATNTHDIDLAYRKYSMTTGWEWQVATTPATTEPGKINFDPMEVDFGRFIAAQTLYTGAINGMTLAGTGLVATILSLLF